MKTYCCLYTFAAQKHDLYLCKDGQPKVTRADIINFFSKDSDLVIALIVH